MLWVCWWCCEVFSPFVESPWRWLLQNDNVVPETGVDENSLSCEGKGAMDPCVFRHFACGSFESIPFLSLTRLFTFSVLLLFAFSLHTLLLYLPSLLLSVICSFVPRFTCLPLLLFFSFTFFTPSVSFHYLLSPFVFFFFQLLSSPILYPFCSFLKFFSPSLPY